MRVATDKQLMPFFPLHLNLTYCSSTKTKKIVIRFIYLYFSILVSVVECIGVVTEPKLIMEDVRPPMKLAEIKPPHPGQVDDDWFVLLDVAAKSPGILLFYVWLLLLDGIGLNNTKSGLVLCSDC